MTAETKRELFSNYYSMEDVAGLLGISVKTLRNRISRGENHPPILPGKRFDKEEFRRWEKQRAIREVKAG